MTERQYMLASSGAVVSGEGREAVLLNLTFGPNLSKRGAGGQTDGVLLVLGWGGYLLEIFLCFGLCTNHDSRARETKRQSDVLLYKN